MASSLRFSLQIITTLTFLSLLHTSYPFPSKPGSISVSISEKGLIFLKELLIQRAISSLTPLDLPQIEKQVKIPLVGKVNIVLSNIKIYHVEVPSSVVKSDESGISISAVDATAYLSMNWAYSYKAWIIEVSDSGKGTVQVEGMEVDLTVSLNSQEGAINLSVMDYGCSIKDIDIQLDGGASWLYQGLLEAFSGKIESLVEDAVLNKIKQGIQKVDSRLQSLPREISVDDTSALNVTLVKNPGTSECSVDIDVDGLFVDTNKLLASSYHQHDEVSRPLISCDSPAKMVAISLHQNVLNSASLVYFNAEFMRWTVNKLPDQSLLNTSKWRDILPQLYNQFPNERMNLKIWVTSSPSVDISENGITVSIHSDVTLGVHDGGEYVPVACASAAIDASGSAHISSNNLTGSIDLKNISLSLKWSNIGEIEMDMVELMISQVIRDALLPHLNIHLMRGFPLPLIRGFMLQQAEIVYTESKITAYSDVAFIDDSLEPFLSILGPSWPLRSAGSVSGKSVA